MSKLTRSYSSKINSILKKILKEEEKKFFECAKLISKSYKKSWSVKDNNLKHEIC